MADPGILTEDDRVELIEGEIVDMPPVGSLHAGNVNRLNNLFVGRLSGHAIVSVQNPIHLGLYSAPQPDIALLKPRADYYARAHPEPKDILLVVEVSDATLPYDGEVKLPLDARSSIPEVWIVNLVDHRLEVYWEPSPEGYQRQAHYQ